MSQEPRDRISLLWRCTCGKMGQEASGPRAITLPEGTAIINDVWAECECGEKWYRPYQMDAATLKALRAICAAREKRMREVAEEMWQLLEYHLGALQAAIKEPGLESMPEPYYKIQGAIDFLQTVLDPHTRKQTAKLLEGLEAK